MGKIILDSIVLTGQIEKDENFQLYFKNLRKGIKKISGIDPYTPTKAVQKEHPNIESQLRQINVKIAYKCIIYLVTDQNVPLTDGSYLPTRTKGYIQWITSPKKLREISNHNKLKKLGKTAGINIGEDHIE